MLNQPHLDPKSMQYNGTKPLKVAQKAIVLHTLGSRQWKLEGSRLICDRWLPLPPQHAFGSGHPAFPCYLVPARSHFGFLQPGPPTHTKRPSYLHPLALDEGSYSGYFESAGRLSATSWHSYRKSGTKAQLLSRG